MGFTALTSWGMWGTFSLKVNGVMSPAAQVGTNQTKARNAGAYFPVISQEVKNLNGR